MSKLSDFVKDLEIKSKFKNVSFTGVVHSKAFLEHVVFLLDNLDFEASANVDSIDNKKKVRYFLKFSLDATFAEMGLTYPIFAVVDAKNTCQISFFKSNVSVMSSNTRWFEEALISINTETVEIASCSLEEDLYNNLIKYLEYKRINHNTEEDKPNNFFAKVFDSDSFSDAMSAATKNI